MCVCVCAKPKNGIAHVAPDDDDDDGAFSAQLRAPPSALEVPLYIIYAVLYIHTYTCVCAYTIRARRWRPARTHIYLFRGARERERGKVYSPRKRRV